ncbi:MAG: hypothetical protein IPM11_00295 [Micropruina sp.]|nr:hypothetical protein [Micropruina sp.]
MAISEQDLDRARAVKRSHEDALLAYPDVTGIDVGEQVTGGKPMGRAAILVYVTKKTSHPVRALPRSLDGVPVDVHELTPELQGGLP